MGNGLNRRDFVRASVAAGVWTFGLGSGRRRVSPAEKLDIAVIGCGGRGWGVLRSLRSQNIAALCDVDSKRAARAFDAYPDVPRFQDYRVLLDQVKSLDAVVVATADHMHAPIAVAAMRRGLHCYCEKPLTWSIHEARVMATVAREKGVATQMGNQGSASDGFRRGVELLRAGVLGDVRELHIWTNRPVWPQALDVPAATPAPSSLNWDLFLGVAPDRPYNKAYHPFAWRGWYDFGTGALGDMACHTWNLAWRGLELGPPESVEAETTQLFSDSYPAGARITYRFPGRGKKPPLVMTWYEGKMRPPAGMVPKELIGRRIPGSGLLAIGSKGMMFSPDDYGSKQRYYPRGIEEIDVPVTLPRVGGRHSDEWVAACKGGPKAYSDFSIAGPFTETVLLGNLAMRTGKKIEWDAEKMEARGVPEAEPLIRRQYREGYTL